MKPVSASSSDLQVIDEQQPLVEVTLAAEPTSNTTEHDYQRDDLSVFFGIGIVVNLTMFVVLVVWGYRQWKKQDERKK